MSHLLRNIACLPPEIRTVVESADILREGVVASRSGEPTLRLHEILLHSLYDPRGEAEKEVEKFFETSRGRVCVVLGFGLAYHIEAILERFEGRVVVYEAAPEIIRTALEVRDLTHVLDRVEIFFDPVIPRLFEEYTLFKHKSSAQISPGFYNRVERVLGAYLEAKKGVKILIVSPFYGGSLPVSRYIADAFMDMGHEVAYLDFSSLGEYFKSIDRVCDGEEFRVRLKGGLKEFASQVVVCKALEWRPDLVLGVAQAPFTDEALARLKSENIRTAFWFMENYRHFRYWRDVALKYDYFFTIQKGRFFDKLEELGVINYAYLPLACLPSVHKPVSLSPDEEKEFASDLSFVGSGFLNRRTMFLRLVDMPLKIWGIGWDLRSPLGKFVQREGAWVSTEDSVKIFCATKVNLNLHASAEHTGVDPEGDFVNPRTFEIAACGAFQLVDERSLLNELFETGREMVTFRDGDDMRRKVEYYLGCPDEREEIAERARERVLREHTYQNRVDEILAFIVERGFEPFRKAEGIRDREELTAEAKDHPELVHLIRSVSGKKRVSIDDLAEVISVGEGELSSAEKLVLLLKEVKDQMAG